MKTMNFKTAFIVCFTLSLLTMTLFSCEHEDEWPELEQKALESIEGEWTWTKTSNDSESHTPTSLGKSVTYKFFSNHLFEEIINGVLVNKGEFRIGMESETIKCVTITVNNEGIDSETVIIPYNMVHPFNTKDNNLEVGEYSKYEFKKVE